MYKIQILGTNANYPNMTGTSSVSVAFWQLSQLHLFPNIFS